jgi:mannosyltransferase OCH1-like enzyme
VIPKIIHQIWIPNKESLPDNMKVWSESFLKYNKEYDYILWDDQTISEHFDLELIYNKYDLKEQHPALQSNILRLLLIQKFGGLYFDTDCECFSSLDDLLGCNFVTNFNGYNTRLVGYNEFFGSIPNGKIINKCLEKAEANISNIHIDIQWKTGWKLFNDVMVSFADKDMILLGPQIFEKYFKHYFTKTWVEKRIDIYDGGNEK